MKKLFAKANEKFVKAVVLYPDQSNVLCYDSEATDKVPAAMLKNLFEKGLVLVHTDDVDYRPTAFVAGEDYYEVKVVTFAGSPAAATLVTYKSDDLE